MKKKEPELLHSLETLLKEVTPKHPLRKPEGPSLAEFERRFLYEYGPLIEQIVEFQEGAQCDPELQALSAAAAEVAKVGADGRVDPRAVGVAERIMQNPKFAALSEAAASYGVRGTGLITVQVEAAYRLGVQLGAEVVYMRPYAVGDYTVPSQAVCRAWFQITAGPDLGISGTIAPWPFDLSFWFTAPVETKHLITVYVTYVPLKMIDLPNRVLPVGLRLEVFGWLPAETDPGIDPSKVLDHIHGFRLVVETGKNHKGAGAGIGRQVTTDGGYQPANLLISPNNLAAGLKSTLSGTISAPRDGGVLDRIIRTATTLTLTFPKWVFSGSPTLPALQFTDDGAGSTGWNLTKAAVSGDTAVYTFGWVGKDNTAWKQDMKFTVLGYSADTPPQSDEVNCVLDKLDSSDTDLNRSVSRTQMSLSALILNAVGTFGLAVDSHCTIDNQPPDVKTVSGSLTATTANSATNNDNDWYGIADPTDGTKYLTIHDSNGDSWWCGYQFRQATTDAGDVCAQYRAVLWKANTSAVDHNYWSGQWQYALAGNTAHSVAIWSDGGMSSGTTLDVFLKPAS